MLLSKRTLRSGATALLLLVLVTLPLAAQSMPGAGVASQNLRAYRFVFIAYALAWIFVLGWVLAVARKLSRLTRRLGD